MRNAHRHDEGCHPHSPRGGLTPRRSDCPLEAWGWAPGRMGAGAGADGGGQEKGRGGPAKGLGSRGCACSWPDAQDRAASCSHQPPLFLGLRSGPGERVEGPGLLWGVGCPVRSRGCISRSSEFSGFRAVSLLPGGPAGSSPSRSRGWEAVGGGGGKAGVQGQEGGAFREPWSARQGVSMVPCQSSASFTACAPPGTQVTEPWARVPVCAREHV